MNFAETIEVLQGLPDRVVEVNVAVPDDGAESRTIASFSGRVESVKKSTRKRGPELWWVWFAPDGEPKPSGGVVALRAEAFEDASVSGSGRSLEDVIAEDDDQTGTTWDITIRQLGVVTTITVYV